MGAPSYGMSPCKAIEDIFQYAVVKFISTGPYPYGVELLDGAIAGDWGWGVCQTLCMLGQPCEVETRHGFQTRVVAAGAFAAGVRLGPGVGAAQGKVIAHAGGTFTLGTAMEAASGAGAIIKMMITLETIALP